MPLYNRICKTDFNNHMNNPNDLKKGLEFLLRLASQKVDQHPKELRDEAL